MLSEFPYYSKLNHAQKETFTAVCNARSDRRLLDLASDLRCVETQAGRPSQRRSADRRTTRGCRRRATAAALSGASHVIGLWRLCGDQGAAIQADSARSHAADRRPAFDERLCVDAGREARLVRVGTAAPR